MITTQPPTFEPLPACWQEALQPELAKPYWSQLLRFVGEERLQAEIFPPEGQVLTAFRKTPLDRVRVVILGQDPYHGPGQAHGLAFSVPRGQRMPPSLRNVLREIADQLDVPPRLHGELSSWCDQGVFLLNSVLTVRSGAAGSHRKRGWERFTERVLGVLDERREGLVFLLWGRDARRLGTTVVDPSRHLVLESGHPSPLSIRFFRGNGHFRRTNEYLEERGQRPIVW
ncbi:MAG: uracil-DNA glycosylase [Acidobacteriota bacterium]